MFAKAQLLPVVTNAFAQLDLDFVKYREIGGDCHLKKDYACAEKNHS